MCIFVQRDAWRRHIEVFQPEEIDTCFELRIVATQALFAGFRVVWRFRCALRKCQRIILLNVFELWMHLDLLVHRRHFLNDGFVHEWNVRGGGGTRSCRRWCFRRWWFRCRLGSPHLMVSQVLLMVPQRSPRHIRYRYSWLSKIATVVSTSKKLSIVDLSVMGWGWVCRCFRRYLHRQGWQEHGNEAWTN